MPSRRLRSGRGGSSTTSATATPATARSTVGSQIAAETPNRSATTAMPIAAIPTPTGCAIWRTPMASPRRCGGNQPTTTRPLAALVHAEAAPANPSATASSGTLCVSAPAAPASVAPVSPVSSAKRSPRRSTTSPHSTSVSITPMVGAAATSPASASE